MTALLGIQFEIAGMKLESLNKAFRNRYGRRSEAKQQRLTAWATTLARLNRNTVRLPAIVTITRIAPGTLDDDNLAGSAKSVRDGIADALGIDDRDARLSWKYAQERAPRGTYGVRVWISATEPRW